MRNRSVGVLAGLKPCPTDALEPAGLKPCPTTALEPCLTRALVLRFSLSLLVLVGLVGFVGRAGAAQAQSSDERELKQYRLTMDKIQKVKKATANMIELAKSDASLREKFEKDDDQSQSLDDMVKQFESEPRLAAAIRSAGTTPRDFILTQLTLFQAVMLAEMRESGAIKELPKDSGTLPENVALVEANQAELKALMEEWQKLTEESEDEGQ